MVEQLELFYGGRVSVWEFYDGKFDAKILQPRMNHGIYTVWVCVQIRGVVNLPTIH